MTVQIMVTNGGAHPADKWAEMTTETLLALIQVQEDSVSDEATQARTAKRDLRTVLFNILNKHHGNVQKGERSQCKADAKRAASRRFDPGQHHANAAAEVDGAFAMTPFAEHFAKPEVREIVHRIIAQHFINSMDIERKYHADRAKGK